MSHFRILLSLVAGYEWSRLGGWRSGLLCATRVRLIDADCPDGLAGPWFVVGSRCLKASVAGEAGCSEAYRGFPARAGPPPTQPTG